MHQAPIVVLFIVFILISVRNILNIKLEIWQIMLGGAVVVILTGSIKPYEAVSAIDMDVMFFLFGMFVIAQALEKSGYISHISYGLFKRTKNEAQLLLYVLFISGIASAFLMNDTIAIIGTPVVLHLARKHKISSKPLLFALAFGVTTGSMLSPIGNPQNLLIAVKGDFKEPFTVFFEYLFIPTLVSLFTAYLIIRYFYNEDFHERVLNHSQEPIKDHNLKILSKVSLCIVAVLIISKIFISYTIRGMDFRLTYIAILGALPVLMFSKKRLKILRDVDWHTLIFFAAMFVLMKSVWNTGFFQKMISTEDLNITSIGSILIIGIVVSQLISNVPLVALYLPILMHTDPSFKNYIALAAGSTLAGNLMILGAASNVIIIQNAEKNHDNAISFIEFIKLGIPLTFANIVIIYVWLKLLCPF
ncbi:MAG: anion transporter [Deltaproteobacteria bacterium]|nr:anion transporter [Deltaproteobacteria bacterium]MCL5791934.1 anion transporter [Deltaproteobacteria bacterium]